eukprot:jgi/Ulvmu1/10037/UM059_0087.1
MALTRLSLARRATASLLWPCCEGCCLSNGILHACTPDSAIHEQRRMWSLAAHPWGHQSATAGRSSARQQTSSAPSRANAILASASSSAELGRQHIGKYYPLDEARIPEAFDQWYSNRDRRASRTVPIDGGGVVHPLPSFVAGCPGLQHELALSKYPYILYRSAYAAVWDMVMTGSREDDRRVIVKGAPGCGKSVFLAATAEYLRQQGWLVMYVPDCSDITFKNMSYTQNPETEMYDTRDAAQNILRAVLDAHGSALKELPQQVAGGSGSLYDLVSLDDTATDAQLCNAVVRLKLELYALPRSTPSAVILDNYNSLFWSTDMFAPERIRSKKPARRLDAQELTLGANLRALADGSTGSTAVIVASSVSGSVPRLPVQQDCQEPVTEVTVPLLAAQEVAAVLQWYRHVHAIAPEQVISESGTQAAWQLTQGSGTEIRRNLHFLLPYSKELEDLDTLGEQYANVSLYH